MVIVLSLQDYNSNITYRAIDENFSWQIIIISDIFVIISLRDVDDLSDLSENETRSDISSLDSDTAEEDDVSDVKDAMRHILRHDVPQTKAENPQMPRSPSPPTSPPVTKNILQNSLEPVSVETRPAVQQTKTSVPEITADRLLAMDLVSIDSENGDPKFVILPADVTVMEGEVARFSCRLSGTDPLG